MVETRHYTGGFTAVSYEYFTVSTHSHNTPHHWVVVTRTLPVDAPIDHSTRRHSLPTDRHQR